MLLSVVLEFIFYSVIVSFMVNVPVSQCHCNFWYSLTNVCRVVLSTTAHIGSLSRTKLVSFFSNKVYLNGIDKLSLSNVWALFSMSGSLITGQCFSLTGFKVLHVFCFSKGASRFLRTPH